MRLVNQVSDVLRDMLVTAESEARNAGDEGIELLELAHELATPVMLLEGESQLQGLESIGHGLKSGLAAITNEKSRALLESIFERSLNFATLIGKATLGKLGSLLP
jgi:hypothetical protein